MELRYYQKDAINSIINEFNNNRNALVSLMTGTGKSLVIAGLIEKLKINKSCCRVLMVVDSATLVKQNREKILKVNPTIKIATFSASLKEKRLNEDIVCATIQSIYKKTPNELGYFDVLLVDEVQMISPKENTTYRILINKSKSKNMWFKCYCV